MKQQCSNQHVIIYNSSLAIMKHLIWRVEVGFIFLGLCMMWREDCERWFMKGIAKVLNLSATKEIIPKQRKDIDC